MRYGNILRRAACALVAAGLLAAADPGKAWAHGVENPGVHEKAEAPLNESWFALLFSSVEAAAHMTVSEQDGYRYIEADGLPDYATGQFPNPGNPNTISEQDYEFRVPLEPEIAGRITQLRRQAFGIALNGVPFDPGTAECWNNDCSSGWNIEALGGAMDLGLDDYLAHVQPNGAYHYHALPIGLLERLPYTRQPVLLGYAADGFPIYGPYGYTDADDPSSRLMGWRPGWRIKSGMRTGGPGGQYDGTYTQDYEYVGGKFRLDECNGREAVTPEYPDGIYHYVLTGEFPFIPRCYKGTPDASFERQGGPPGGGGQQVGGRPDFGQPSGLPPQHDDQRPGGPPPRDGQRTGGPLTSTGELQGGGAEQDGSPGRHPDLNQAAATLGIDVETLRRALGPPPPDFARVAAELGVSEQQLRQALPRPRR